MEPKQLAQRALDAQAWQEPRELEDFIVLLQERDGIHNVLEIGLGAGGTSWLWRELFGPKAYIVGVDILDRLWCEGCNERKAHSACPNVRVRDALSVQVVGDSIDPETLAKVDTVLPDGMFDFLFVDGAHDREHVEKELATYGKRVRSGGLIAFHDITDYPDVVAFWLDLRKQFPKTTRTIQHSWGGIGVLDVP